MSLCVCACVCVSVPMLFLAVIRALDHGVFFICDPPCLLRGLPYRGNTCTDDFKHGGTEVEYLKAEHVKAEHAKVEYAKVT